MTFDGRDRASRADQTTVRRANLGVVLRHIATDGVVLAGARSRRARASPAAPSRASSRELVELELRAREGGDAAPRGVGRPGVALELADVVVGDRARGQRRLRRRVARGSHRRGALRAPLVRRQPRLGSGPVLDRLGTRRARRARAPRPARACGRSGSRWPCPASSRRRRARSCSRRTSAGTGSPSPTSSETRLGLPVLVENESNLAALAEHWTGAAVGIDDFVCVFGEVGVGGGVVLGGRLFRGTHGFGGEFGHVSVDPEGRRCACGSRGCVETLVGQESIAAAAGISTADGRTQSLTDELVRRAEDGSKEVVAALDDAGRWLGIALASTFNVLDLAGRRARRLLRPARTLARRRRSPDARGAVARRAIGVVRRRPVGVRGRRSRPWRRGTVPATRPRGALGGAGRGARSEEIPASMPGSAGRGKEVAIGHA